MRIPAESVVALTQLGYVEREAEFLYIVAVHSGFSLRRKNGLSVPSVSISYKLLSPFHGGESGAKFHWKSIVQSWITDRPGVLQKSRRFSVPATVLAVFSRVGR